MDDQREGDTQAPSDTDDVGSEARISRFSAEYLWGCKDCKKSDKCRPEGLRRRIVVVCFDGTDNQFGNKSSNVVQFYSQILEDEGQIPYYNSGIGTYAKESKVWRNLKMRFDNNVDKAVAWNFEKVLLGGYRFLVEHYRPGYRIFIYGFSRGAYQARTLAAMISKVGLLRKGNEEQIPLYVGIVTLIASQLLTPMDSAYELYCSINETSSIQGSNNPNRGGIREKLANLMKKVYSRKDLQPNCTEKIVIVDREDGELPEETFKRAFSQRDTRVHFIGVWDTVSSVGLVRGKNLPGTDSVHEHACYVRHAIALDERRVKFLPEYVDRKLRIDGHCSRPQVKEVWFAGCHSDVGGGSQLNERLNQNSPSFVWMKNESQIHGLRMQRSEEELDPKQPVKSGCDFHESLSGLWHIPEYLLIKRVTYAGHQPPAHFTRAPHHGQGRIMLHGQTIHLSVYLKLIEPGSTYIPKAKMARNDYTWEDLKKLPHPLGDQKKWSERTFDELELDLIDLSLIRSIVTKIMESRPEDSASYQNLLRFLSHTSEGAECILSYFDMSVEALPQIVVSPTPLRTFFFFEIISTSITKVASLPSCMDNLVWMIIDIEADSATPILRLDALLVIARRYGRLPLPILHSKEANWHEGLVQNSSRWASIICLASTFYGRFLQSREYSHLEKAQRYIERALTEHQALDKDRPTSPYLRNCSASIKEAGAILDLSRADNIIREAIGMRVDLEDNFRGFKLDVTKSRINLSQHLLHRELGRSLSGIRVPTYTGPNDSSTPHSTLSIALANLAESNYRLMKRNPLTAAKESITLSTILSDAVRAVNLSPEYARSRAKALDLVSNCYLEETKFDDALQMSDEALRTNRSLVAQSSEPSRLLYLSVALVTHSRCLLAHDKNKAQDALVPSTEAILILRLLLKNSHNTSSTEIRLMAALDSRADIFDALDRHQDALRDRQESFELWMKQAERHPDCKDIAPFFEALCRLERYDRALSEALRAEDLRFRLIHESKTPPNIHARPKSPLLMLSEIQRLASSSQAGHTAREAIKFYLQHTPVYTRIHDADLASSYMCLFDACSSQQRSCARDKADTAIKIYRGLALVDEEDDTANLKLLASCLERISKRLWELEGGNEGFATDEIIKIYEDLYSSNVTSDVNAFRIANSSLPDDVRSPTNIRRILRLYQEVIKTHPSVYSEKCLVFLNRLSDFLRLNNNDEARSIFSGNFTGFLNRLSGFIRPEEGATSLRISYEPGPEADTGCIGPVEFPLLDLPEDSSPYSDYSILQNFWAWTRKPSDTTSFEQSLAEMDDRGAEAMLRKSTLITILIGTPQTAQLGWKIVSVLLDHDDPAEILIKRPYFVDAIGEALKPNKRRTPRDKTLVSILNKFDNRYGELPLRTYYNGQSVITNEPTDSDDVLNAKLASLYFGRFLRCNEQGDLTRACKLLDRALIPDCSPDTRNCHATLLEAKGTKESLLEAAAIREELVTSCRNSKNYRPDLHNTIMNLACCLDNHEHDREYGHLHHVTSRSRRDGMTEMNFAERLAYIPGLLDELNPPEAVYEVLKKSLAHFGIQCS